MGGDNAHGALVLRCDAESRSSRRPGTVHPRASAGAPEHRCASAGCRTNHYRPHDCFVSGRGGKNTAHLHMSNQPTNARTAPSQVSCSIRRPVPSVRALHNRHVHPPLIAWATECGIRNRGRSAPQFGHQRHGLNMPAPVTAKKLPAAAVATTINASGSSIIVRTPLRSTTMN